MKAKFIFITFLLLLAAALTYLSLPKEVAQKEITKEISFTPKS